MKTKLLPILAATSCALFATGANAQGYDYETVDYPGADFTNLFGANQRGDAVGNADIAPDEFAFVYGSKKGDIDVVTPVAGYDSTAVIDISDSGVVVGSVYDAVADVQSGLIIDKQGNVIIFDHPDSDLGVTQARGINSRGMVTGLYFSSELFIIHGFIYDTETGEFTDIETSRIAQGINDRGEVVGGARFFADDDPCGFDAPVGIEQLGFLRGTDGALTYFRVNGQFTSARGISDHGTVVGFVTDPFTQETKGFVTELDGTQCQDITIADEELLQAPGATRTFVQDISNSGKTIVGAYDDGAFDPVTGEFIVTFSSGFVATPE